MKKATQDSTVHSMWFYLKFKTGKFICTVRNLILYNQLQLEKVEMEKGLMRDFLGANYHLFLDLSVVYQMCLVCENVSNYTLMIM